MAGLSDVLGIATRGLQTTQRGIATTGHNIANVNTPGYSRQRSVLQASRPIGDAAGTLGTGVEQLTVDRIIDEFTQTRLMGETTRASGLTLESDIYRQVEVILNDQQSPGLTDELTGFFDSIDDLANSIEEGQGVARNEMLSSAESLIDTIHRFDSQLRSLQTASDRALTSLLPEINAISAQIAEMNGDIAEAEVIAPANDLRDQRDQLVLDLARKVEITTIEQRDGMVSIRVAGGISLVEGRVASDLVAVVDPASPNPFDPTFSQVYYQSGGNFFDVTNLVRGGELGATIDARENIIGGTIRELDAFAFSLSEEFNAVHRTGRGLADGAAHDFFLDLSARPSVADAARDIRLAADVDPAQGGTAANIAVGLDPGGTPAAAGDTRNAQLLGDLRNQGVTRYLPGDVPGTPTGSSVSILAGLVDTIGDVGQRAQSANRALAQQESVLQSVQDRRDAVSGVDIDEEVAELVQLQASFQANARVISMVNQLFDDLLNSF